MKNVTCRYRFTLLTLLCTPLPLLATPHHQPELGHQSAALLMQAGLQFKDLNNDGRLNPYEDWRLSAAQRASDLLKRMTLEEKVGLMMHGTAPVKGSVIGSGDAYDLAASGEMIRDKQVNSLITRLSGDKPSRLAEQNNALQAIAEKTRLGIPITISTDPRNAYEALVGASSSAGKFSQWPETLGIAATASESLARRYAEQVRKEYRAVGISQALSPQADIATEPRWARINGTFGEDPQLVRRMVRGYITGIQNGSSGLTPQSVSAVVKHWVGYGAAENGWDGHNVYGKNAVFRTNNLRQHIEPFIGAFEARVSAVMPTYSILKGVTWKGQALEPVAAGFSKFLLTDLLRNEYGFQGVIISDWLITNDCNDECVNGAAEGKAPVPGGMPWGVESLSKQQRFVQAVNAGIDQFGGVTDSEILADAVKKGLISEQRIDASVRRILEQKFALGLFEQPYVDAAQADRIVGSKEAQQEANQAQRDSLVLLQNKNLLPLRPGTRVWLYGADADAAKRAGLVVVSQPQEAEVAIMRTAAPFEQPHYNYFFGRRHHEGSLEWKADNKDLQALNDASRRIPVVMTMYMDRPAVLGNVIDKTHAFIANFGVSDDVLFSQLTANKAWTGRLPFALPSSMESVLKQDESVPNDLVNPLFKLGFGLSR